MPGTSDLLGHRDALSRLWSALERDALHHAYLFEGPEGVGKHTVAVRLAMAANCTADPEVPPCGACPTCRQIAAGTHPDVLVLEPEGDRATPIISVEQVREVVRQAGYHRYNARRRFVIVDPAEAMRTEAANALLKTLEEPPEGTHFALICTHAKALLPTIVSRCQRQRFTSVPESDLAAWLAERDVDEPELAARASLGCPGRALELADGVLAERREVRDRMLAVLGGRLGGVFDWSKATTRGGSREWRASVEGVLDIVDDLLRDTVIRGAGGGAALLNADRVDVIDAWVDALWPDGVARCAEAVQEARRELALNVSGKTLLDALMTQLATELGKARTAGA